MKTEKDIDDMAGMLATGVSEYVGWVSNGTDEVWGYVVSARLSKIGVEMSVMKDKQTGPIESVYWRMKQVEAKKVLKLAKEELQHRGMSGSQIKITW